MFSTRYRPIEPVGRIWFARCSTLLIFLSGLLWPQYSYAQQDVQQQEPAGASAPAAPAATQAAVLPTIRVPYFSDGANPGQGAIFWFGKVEPGANYADVRIAYDGDALVFIMHVFDRRVSYDEKSNSASDLTQFDSVTLYLDAQSDLTAPLGAGARRFDAALSTWQPRDNYQRAYTWDGSAWQAAPIRLRNRVRLPRQSQRWRRRPGLDYALPSAFCQHWASGCACSRFSLAYGTVHARPRRVG